MLGLSPPPASAGPLTAKPAFWERPAFVLYTAAQPDPAAAEAALAAADSGFAAWKRKYDISRDTYTRTGACRPAARLPCFALWGQLRKGLHGMPVDVLCVVCQPRIFLRAPTIPPPFATDNAPCYNPLLLPLALLPLLWHRR